MALSDSQLSNTILNIMRLAAAAEAIAAATGCTLEEAYRQVLEE